MILAIAKGVHMSVIGALFIIGLVFLASWNTISRWLTYMRTKSRGILVEARVTDVKRESRIVVHLGGAASTGQKIVYENFVYAQWKDPVTQHIYLFRIKTKDFHKFHKGEDIPVRIDLKNPLEYFLDYSEPLKQTVSSPNRT